VAKQHPVAFDLRGKRNTNPKWGKKGRMEWRSNCSYYAIQERWEFEGVIIPASERFLLLYGQGCCTTAVSRHKSKGAAINAARKHQRERLAVGPASS
jgi:hypothetical protein